MKILLFGGSFDPPHLGHFQILKAALEFLKPDRAYVVPAFCSPLKSGPRATPKDRLAMTRLLLNALSARDQSIICAHPFEISRNRMTYTYKTLRFIKSLHPDARITFLAGSDALADFSHWRKSGELKKSCFWLVAKRTSDHVSWKNKNWRPDFLPGSFSDIASHDIRARLLAGIDVSTSLPARVLEYIRARRLYGLDMHRWLSKNLSSERCRHSVCVSQQILELARIHHLDMEQAALAGLLHDCGRSIRMDHMAQYARANHLQVPRLRETSRRQPLLLHAYISEDIARRHFGVQDPRALSAIRKHTLGDLTMSPLDQLLYTADTCSRDRDFPEATQVRAAARQNLEEGFRLAVRAKLEHVLSRGTWMHPLSVSVWNQLT